MIILDAVLTYLLVAALLFASGILIAVAEEEAAPVVLGVLGFLLATITATFQGVALVGSLTVTDAVFTYVTATVMLCVPAIAFANKSVWVGVIGVVLAVSAVVCQSIALAI